jgi:hypothetical protein
METHLGQGIDRRTVYRSYTIQHAIGDYSKVLYDTAGRDGDPDSESEPESGQLGLGPRAIVNRCTRVRQGEFQV